MHEEMGNRSEVRDCKAQQLALTLGGGLRTQQLELLRKQIEAEGGGGGAPAAP